MKIERRSRSRSTTSRGIDSISPRRWPPLTVILGADSAEVGSRDYDTATEGKLQLRRRLSFTNASRSEAGRVRQRGV